MKPQLISFKLCPFVQRSVIMLLEKGVDYDITYIDLREPPEWFAEISPLGKVPLLKVAGEVIFESAVIMEYLDEVNLPSMHPSDPLRRAHNRAWIEYASTILMNQYQMITATDQDGYEQARGQLVGKLQSVEEQLKGPFFNGERFSLVDMSFAPAYMRLGYLEQWFNLGLLDTLPRSSEWSKAMLERPSVINSVVAELPQLYRGHLVGGGGYLGSTLPTTTA